MDRPGPDVINSMDPVALKELLVGSCEIQKMQGGNKLATNEEQVTMDFAFATIVTIKDVKKGEKLTKENVWVKRPGTGEIMAESFWDVIGKVATKDIDKNKHLSWDDFK
jgi:N-acetylneuraminate synthase